VNNVEQRASSYNIVTTRKPLSIESTSLIRMKNKVKHWEPLVEVNYVTFSNYCPKCLGIKTVDDLVYTAAGDMNVARREYLLVQRVEKIIVTKINSNPFHDWYGTGLHSLVSSKAIDIGFLKTKIIEQISSAIEKLKSVQRQLIASNRKVDPGELFGQLLGIDVTQADDPTVILVTVTFTSQNDTTLEFSQLIDLSTARERVAFA
jgi:hypothetical protein